MSGPHAVQLPYEMWMVAAQLTQAWATLQAQSPQVAYATDNERVVFDVFDRFATSLVSRSREVK